MDEMNVGGLVDVVERLSAAAAALEQAAERIASRQESLAVSAEESVGRIVATVASSREMELERKLAEAEMKIAEANGKIAELQASASVTPGRKTLPAGVARMFAKEGVTVEGLQGEGLDAALVSLSVEQRIAVKSELMRAGLLG